VQHPALAEWHKILLQPLHIKLGLMKNFIKAMDRTGSTFKYLAEKFPLLSEAKIKERVFVGFQIRNLYRDDMFSSLLQGDEKKAWDTFRLVSSNFLGNIRAENYKELIEDMSFFHKLGCNMSLRIHIFIPIWISSPDNCCMFSDGHGERFHQEIATIKKIYQGKCSTMADYC
jgi:hypothetical protein